ncbi:Diguanylate cyclase [Acrasis kona]|uniref:Diguanylate cyclase n=1 Tax=Acrasis kona TaxID=1008807 RepID=A0AAW2YX39_9EUKA
MRVITKKKALMAVLALSLILMIMNLSAFSKSKTGGRAGVVVATINMYNSNKLWRERLERIAQLIVENNIDIIGLQEVRTIEKEGGLNQLTELMSKLPTDYSYVYEKFMVVGDPNQGGAVVEEGLAIVSKYKINSVRKLHQISKTKNWNNRLCLNGLVDLGFSVLDFYVTHQAIDPVDQCQKMGEVLTFTNHNAMLNQVLLGDFNTYYDFPYPMDLMTSNDGLSFHHNKFQNKNCNQECQKAKFDQCVSILDNKHSNKRPFVDAWEHLKNDEPGHTFTNYKDQDMSRPDRILFRGGVEQDFIAQDIQVIGDTPLPGHGDVYISDHRMVVLQLTIML